MPKHLELSCLPQRSRVKSLEGCSDTLCLRCQASGTLPEDGWSVVISQLVMGLNARISDLRTSTRF